MWPYFALAAFTSIFATSGKFQRVHAGAWVLFFLGLIVFIGLRHRVGVDWNNYLLMILRVDSADGFISQLSVVEPLYSLLLIISLWSGFGMYLANFVTAVFIGAALWRFAKVTPYPWLAVMSSIPIYIVVISMSANRQAIAAAVLMWLIAGWPKYSTLTRVFLVLFASGFHFSAILFLAFVGWEIRAQLWIRVIGSIILGAIVIYLSYFTGRADVYSSVYLSGGDAEQFEASGALQHTLMNSIPAMFYFLLPKQRYLLFPTTLHRNLAFAAIATIPLVFISSIVALRISIYWYPISIWVWSALPLVFHSNSRAFVRFIIVLFMVFIMTVWLNFANSAPWFVPYDNALWLNIWELDIGRTRF